MEGVTMAEDNLEWLPVEDLEQGFNENKLYPTHALAGKDLTLFCDNDQVIHLCFRGEGLLTFGAKENPTGIIREAYEAFCVMPDIYFVDFVINETKSSVSLILDFPKKKSLILIGKLSEWKMNQDFISRSKAGVDLSPMAVEFIHANMDLPLEKAPIVPYERTGDLLGKRVKYTYSKMHTYEHIYLNPQFYTWHCLSGPEKGLADTDRCDYFKIASDLYLFTWREKIIPILGVVLINLKTMKTSGKLFGIEVETGKVTNFTMGAHAQLLNVTTY